VKLFAFHCGGERADWAALDAFDPRVGTKVVIPYFFFLIQHQNGKLLFDSGGHPDLAQNPRARLGPAAEAFEVLMTTDDDLATKLSTIQMSPEDITHVAHSHLHYDHCGGIEAVQHAEFYIQQSELDFAYSPPVYQRNLFVRQDFDHAVHWHQLRGEHDVFGDGRVLLFPTPGHTPGHQSMLVRLHGQTVILVGDAAYLPEKMKSRSLPPIFWRADAMVESWGKIEDMQRIHNAVLLFSHDLDYESSTRLAPDAWYE
jgi:glyoxylase-like metal-dependent hydrolase (beta-lactamase superfamily II)